MYSRSIQLTDPHLKYKRSYGTNSSNIAACIVNIPSMLTREYCERHELSLDDYILLFKCVPAQWLWLMILYLGLDVSDGALQCHNAKNPTSVKYRSPSTAIQRLLNYIKRNWSLSTSNKLIASSEKNQLPLPAHYVGPKEFAALERHTHTTVHKEQYAHVYNTAYKIGDKYFIPVKTQPDRWIMMANVVSKRQVASHLPLVSEQRSDVAWLSNPIEHVVDGVICVETDEYLLVMPKK